VATTDGRRAVTSSATPEVVSKPEVEPIDDVTHSGGRGNSPTDDVDNDDDEDATETVVGADRQYAASTNVEG